METTLVLAALDSIGVPRSCPRCNADAWGGIGPIGAELSVKLLVLDADKEVVPADSLPPGVRCAALICNRCGFVSLHSERVIRRAS